jgi:hypothetical protein
MTTPVKIRRNAAWTPLVIHFVAAHLQGVGENLDLYLLSRLTANTSQDQSAGIVATERVALLRQLIDAGDAGLYKSFPFDSWKLFLSLAHHFRISSAKAAEAEALHELQLEIEKRGAMAVRDDMKLGATRREQQRLFGLRRGTERKRESERLVAEWQKQAAPIWERNPSLSKSDVAKQIEHQFGTGKYETIRRRIEKPTAK